MTGNSPFHKKIMKICILNFAGGGILRYGFSYVSALSGTIINGSVKMLVTEDGLQEWETFSSSKSFNGANKIELIVVGKRLSPLLIVKTMYQLFSADIVHDTAGTSSRIGVTIWPLLFFKKLFITLHDPLPHLGTSYTRTAKLKRYIIKIMATKVVVHGQANLKQALKAGIFKRKLIESQHGCNFIPQNFPTNINNELRVLIFGNIRPDKGVELIPEAHRILKEKILNTKVQCQLKIEVVGRTRLKATAISYSWRENLERTLEYFRSNPDFILRDEFVPDNEIEEIFRAPDIILFPYKDASQSGVLCDALGYGCCIVATAVGGIPDMIQHEVNGLLCEPSPESIADALYKVACDKNLINIYRHGATTSVRNKFSWEQISKIMLTNYNSID